MIAMEEFKIHYDFSNTYNTLYGITIENKLGFIIFNNVCLKNEVSLQYVFNSNIDVAKINDLQQAIYSVIDKELNNNINYCKYYNQNALRKALQWIKDQLTIETITNFITTDCHIHSTNFNYNYFKETIKIPLAHVQDFFVEKSTWKYCCNDCNTVGEITTNKGETINSYVKCKKCGSDFMIIN
jgi:hypothetical protein